MRRVLTVVMAAGAIAFAPAAAAEPAGNCPPSCNRIPAAAWIAPGAIPLDAHYHWPTLSGHAVSTRAPRFRFEEVCAGPAVVEDPRAYAVTERTTVVHPDGQWQLQAQILHWRGETWRGGQLAQDTLNAAVSSVRNCQQTNPGASPSLTLAESDRIAVAISGPVILHDYLLADPVSSTVTELALWAVAPVLTPWPAVADAAVLAALATPLCTAYIGSCP